MILAIYFDEHLIEVPLISGPGTPSAQSISVSLAELQSPLTDRFVGNDNATHSHDFFDISVAESEAEVERATRSLETALRLGIRDLDQL
jgi:hypothetical protein